MRSYIKARPHTSKVVKSAKIKQRDFLVAKFNDYSKLTLDELKKVFNEKKLSRTERIAIIEATRKLMVEERNREVKVIQQPENDQVTSENIQTTQVGGISPANTLELPTSTEL